MHRLILIAALALAIAPGAMAGDARPWLPKDYTIPSRTISPDGLYGVMITDSEDYGPGKLVELKTGRIVAVLAGNYGREKPDHTMRWGNMGAYWSTDSSLLCWICPGKWFPDSFIAVKLHGGKLAWQVDLMKAAQTEILDRTEDAAPLNFAVAKLDNAEDGSAYPEGFSVDVSEPASEFALPLVCKVTLVSDPKGNDEEPAENQISSWLTMTLANDGSVSFSHFKLERGRMAAENVQKAKESLKKSHPLIDTDIGKALLFQGMASKDGRYCVGWTVRPAAKGLRPVDWSRWDAHDPDKLLRHYDWQNYSYGDAPKKTYEAVNFVIDLRSGSTLELPMESPYWPGKRDNGDMTTVWGLLPDGRNFGLIKNADQNFWLVTIDAKGFRRKDLMPAMRKSVNGLLRERRPMVADPDYYIVSYDLDAAKKSGLGNGLAKIPFIAEYPESDKRELGLRGDMTVGLADGAVTNISSKAKLLEPFVTNKELRDTDEKLNTLYQGLLKSLPPDQANALKEKQRAWIAKRNDDADQAVNITSYDATEDDCEKAKEKSLLDSTKARIGELETADKEAR